MVYNRISSINEKIKRAAERYIRPVQCYSAANPSGYTRTGEQQLTAAIRQGHKVGTAVAKGYFDIVCTYLDSPLVIACIVRRVIGIQRDLLEDKIAHN